MHSLKAGDPGIQAERRFRTHQKKILIHLMYKYTYRICSPEMLKADNPDILETGSGL